MAVLVRQARATICIVAGTWVLGPPSPEVKWGQMCRSFVRFLLSDSTTHVWAGLQKCVCDAMKCRGQVQALTVTMSRLCIHGHPLTLLGL